MDVARVAVGGHSYGAFMAANLLVILFGMTQLTIYMPCMHVGLPIQVSVFLKELCCW